ncbi:MAG TPA: vitamin K epoxide reductase family protein [Candidatus Nanoarchaeia archaeon]|nr:vitamin K epoxide reductase family protein [Candidatus Nanoarchaeia archaeon]
MKSKNLIYTLLAISLLGLVTSLYLVKDHYQAVGSACDFSATISCSIVNSSIFSEIFNVPVAVLGAIWFVFLAGIAWQSLKKKEYLWALLVWNVGGLFSVIYLAIAEIILKALCPFCTIVHALVITSLILSYLIYKKDKPKMDLKKLKGLILLVVIINLIPLILFNVGSVGKDHSELAKCLTNNGVNMYGSFRCGVCAKTRAMFGDSFQYINEIECHPQGENAQTELCLSKNIGGTPTWILEPEGVEQKRYTGFLSIEELAEFAGCPIAS